MKKSIVNLICFPFLFLFFIGKSVAAAIGQKDNQAVPIAFVALICLGIVFGGSKLLAEPQEEVVVPEGDDPGVYFIPAAAEQSVVDHTMLESALIQFNQRHGRLPKNMAEFQASGILVGLPEPKEGFEYRLDLEYPEIVQVPIGTEPEPKNAESKTE